MNLDKLQKLLSNQKLNPYINIENTDKVFLHLIEEIGEAVQSYRKGEKDKLRLELGDIQILLLFLSESLHIDLSDATFDKLVLNVQTGKFKMSIGDMINAISA